MTDWRIYILFLIKINDICIYVSSNALMPPFFFFLIWCVIRTAYHISKHRKSFEHWNFNEKPFVLMNFWYFYFLCRVRVMLAICWIFSAIKAIKCQTQLHKIMIDNNNNNNDKDAIVLCTFHFFFHVVKGDLRSKYI